MTQKLLFFVYFLVFLISVVALTLSIRSAEMASMTTNAVSRDMVYTLKRLDEYRGRITILERRIEWLSRKKLDLGSKEPTLVTPEGVAEPDEEEIEIYQKSRGLK